MLEFLIKANVEVGILIVIVIILRHPFSKFFGSHATYALWLLPIFAFFFPRITFTSKSEFVPAELSMPLPKIADVLAVQDSPATLTEVSPDLIIPVFLLGWIIVGVGWLVTHITFYRRTYYLEVLNSRSFDESWQETVDRVGSNLGLKRLPNVRISDTHEKALSFGFLNPVIILPKSIDEHFSDTEREQILMHEFMHVKRRDAWAGLAALMFQALNWPNPLVHIGAHYFRIDMEANCDADVAKAILSESGTSTSYQQTLLKTAKFGEA